MDKHTIQGKGKQFKGSVKENIGDALDDRELQSEGMGDRVKGKVQEGFGKVKEAVREGERKLRH